MPENIWKKMDTMKEVKTFLPQDDVNEKSRVVKICTRSSHVLIVFFMLIILFLFTIYKSIENTANLESYIIRILNVTKTK